MHEQVGKPLGARPADDPARRVRRPHRASRVAAWRRSGAHDGAVGAVGRERGADGVLQ